MEHQKCIFYKFAATKACRVARKTEIPPLTSIALQVGQPTDSAKPLGAHKLEDCKPESITKFEKEIISGGLIPKMVNHDNCLTVLFGEKTLAFEFETEEEYKAWTSLLKKQATNVVKFKSKIAENDPRPLIEQLTNKYPSNRS
jgi:hypothetical protein